MSTKRELHTKVMNKVQEEWEENEERHITQRFSNDRGIRSSQISAVIAFLIDIGVIKEEDL